jgi:hypothetical protein
MIRCKTTKGRERCRVYSKSGKPLSKPGMSRAAAERRLAQVEYFKHKSRK